MRRVKSLVIAALMLLPKPGGSVPSLAVDDELGARTVIESIVRDAWNAYARRFKQDTGTEAKTPLESLAIRAETSLPFGHAGGASPGVIGVRQARAGVIDERLAFALRHEVAHQFLWSACPAGADDRLFHEAYAVASSGEIQAWTRGEYLSLPAAAAALRRARNLDAPSARRALARVLLETTNAGAMTPSIKRRLLRCADGAAWGAPMTVDELATTSESMEEALVVISRHSGEVVVSKGAVHHPMPYGSTLKPFVLAGALAGGAKPPNLKPRTDIVEWACAKTTTKPMAADTALLRSCNGWFLDWGNRDGKTAQLGAFGPALVRLGLAREPKDMAEAIGLRSTLALSPLAMAAAYRLLGESRPDVVDILRRNAMEGTLSKLPASSSLQNWALKTGTVRDERSATTVGWIVGMNADFVVVMARPKEMPRTFASDFARVVKSLPQVAAHAAVQVQTFGLLDLSTVQVRCRGRAFAVNRRGVLALGNGWLPLSRTLESGALTCVDGPWNVRFSGQPGREYAGVFRSSPAPAYRGAPSERAGGSVLRARRGSDVVFETTLGRYVAGVVEAEDASLSSAAKEALSRVIAHNARHSRHDGRPVCDTTHCQAFLGTKAPGESMRDWVSKPVPGASKWLLFSQGGLQPWSETRRRSELDNLIGTRLTQLSFVSGRARWVMQSGLASMPFDEVKSVPCEAIRGPLKLPSCPQMATFADDVVHFTGRGRGHGEGLDVEAAKEDTRGADAILQEAYGGR